MGKNTEVNAIQNIYNEFLKILKNITIKYSCEANKMDTFEVKMAAEEYFGAYYKKDNFFTYSDYTKEELDAVGCYDCQYEYFRTYNDDIIPMQYREPLLENRRAIIINNFEEKNDYYRMLNGYPNVSDHHYYYLTESIANAYGIDVSIPIHEIQDYYNETTGNGDYLISLVEGTGYISALYADIQKQYDNGEISYDKYYSKTYLKYIGTKRIDLYAARKANNFEILQLLNENINFDLYNEFLRIYDQCREYFVTTIFVADLRNVIERYDNFIAMCIMVMTIQQLVMRQITLGTNRTFFDIYAVKALYEAYNIPYNLKLSDEIQKGLIQNLNLLIQDKATDKVLYDIGSLLGFSNLYIYKYYLGKQQKYDGYGVPIVQYTEKFNTDTGEVETVPDYEAMYDIIFQKTDIRDENFITAFNSVENRAPYEITNDDPFWIKDKGLYEKVWETEYNFVESKYLGIGLAYRLTDLIFDNVVLMKMIISQENAMDQIRITLPKISGQSEVSVFDCIIALICLTCRKHRLYGDIITIPTQVISVLDFMQNVEGGDEYLVDTLSLDFSYFDPENEDAQKAILELRDMLGEQSEEFMGYVTDIMNNASKMTSGDKVEAINALYKDTKALYTFISFMLSKTHDRKTYEALLTMYHAAFYAKEVKDVFTITGETTSFKRTAWSYFEYFYHKCPLLYNIMFTVDFKKQWREYLEEHSIPESELPFDEYIVKYERGEIKVYFGELKISSTDEEDVEDELIYTYASHIISRLQLIIDDIDMNSLMGDIKTPTEELLVKLVRFFKSYTTELISYETILICDLKTHQIIKLFDEIHYIEKLIQMNDELRMRYGDVVNHIIATMNLESMLVLNDWQVHEVTILVDNLYDWVVSKIPLRDSVKSMESTKEKRDSFRGFYDIPTNISAEITAKDNDYLKETYRSHRFRDSVHLEWEDED